MGKPSYIQRYHKKWKKQYKWLRPVETDNTKAYYVYCKSELYAKNSDLIKHSETLKHKTRAVPFTSQKQQKIQFKKENVNSRIAEGHLALFIAEHCSLMTIDHLSELCSKFFPDSETAKDIKLHRTKCMETIKNVLVPHFVEELVSDIGSQGYSIIIDESTDIAVTKVLGVVIRYFSITLGRVISRFLSLLVLVDGTAVSIAQAIT